jgi:hypothetical protein
LDLGDIDTCARFNDIEQARQFYEGVDLYLTILEYEHDTTLEFLRDLFLSGGTEMGIGMLIAEFGVSEATAGIAGDFIMGVRDEANDEGIKDLRRFRDDLGQAVSSWQEHIDSGLIDEAAGESMYMTISVRRNAINPDSYTVRLMHRHKLDSERAKYNFSDYENLIQDEFSLSAGGPFGGRVNNFGKTASALMVVGIPSEQIGGHVTKYGWVGNMRTYDTNGSALFWR